MLFIAHVKQSGEGCDYTIACGETVWKIDAPDKNTAIKRVRRKVIGEYLPEYNIYEDGYWDESRLERIVL